MVCYNVFRPTYKLRFGVTELGSAKKVITDHDRTLIRNDRVSKNNEK